MSEHNIEKLVEDTIQSFDGAKRAEPKPFLFTRVIRAINSRGVVQNTWMRIGTFISKPAIAAAGLFLIIFLNTAILVISKKNTDGMNVQLVHPSSRDEFAINTTTIYDIENPDPQ